MTDTVVTSNPSANLAASFIRTFVPIVAGAVGTVLLKLGIHITGDLTPIVSAALSYLYYVAVRVLEHFQSSKWGWLLGKATAPVYATGTQVAIPPAGG